MVATSRFSLLIADDDSDARRVLREIFDPAGFQTHTAQDGQEAIRIVQRERIHLLLVDMYMPQMTGLETIQAVRQARVDLPAILLTGSSESPSLLRKALMAQVFCVLTKPIREGVVTHHVERALQKHYAELLAETILPIEDLEDEPDDSLPFEA